MNITILSRAFPSSAQFKDAEEIEAHFSAAGSVLSSYESATFRSPNFHICFQVTAHLSSPRMNSRVPLPRRPRFRPLLVPIRASHCRDDCPERAQPSLPRMNLAIRAARPCPGQITKKVMKLTGRPHITKHNCAQRKIVDAYF